MEKLSNYLVALLTLVLLSCSSNALKDINPTSTEFISGELAKQIEIVDESCQLSYAESNGTIPSQYIKLKVKLRLTKESSSLQNVDARDIDFTGLLSVATINLVDENDTKVQNLNVRTEDLLKLKRLLQGKVGDEEVITFEGEFHNSKEAPKWFEQATAFTPYLTADAVVKSGEMESNNENSFSLNLRGVLGGSDDAELIYNDKTDDGEVVFTVNGAKNIRKIKLGSYNKVTNKLVLNEFFTNGNYVGDFDGIWKDGIYQGTFTNTKGGSINFRLQGTAGNGNFLGSYSNNNCSYDNDEISIDDEGDPSVDRFLDEYENFFDHYMSYIKKMNKDDPTFMIEYAKLLNSYQKLVEREKQLKSKMSMSQLNRLNNISVKLMQEMQKMQQYN